MSPLQIIIGTFAIVIVVSVMYGMFWLRQESWKKVIQTCDENAIAKEKRDLKNMMKFLKELEATDEQI